MGPLLAAQSGPVTLRPPAPAPAPAEPAEDRGQIVEALEALTVLAPLEVWIGAGLGVGALVVMLLLLTILPRRRRREPVSLRDDD